MKKILIIALVLSCTLTMAAQNPNGRKVTSLTKNYEPIALKPVKKANYDMAERFSTKKMNRLVKSSVLRPNWFQYSDKFWYSWESTEGKQYYIVDPASKTKKPIFDLDKLAAEISTITHDGFDAKHIPIKNLKLKNDKVFTFTIQSNLLVPKKDTSKVDKNVEDSTKIEKRLVPEMEKKNFHFEYNIVDKTLVDVTDRDAELDKKDFPRWASISPDSSLVVYSKGFDFYYTDMENLKKFMKDAKDSTFVEHKLTKDGTPLIAYGGGNYFGSEERDSSKRYYPNISWSPDSRHFASILYDMTKVKHLWVINSLSKPRPTLEKFQYQMPGEAGPVASLWVFDMKDKSKKKINIEAFKEQELEVMSVPANNVDKYKDYFVKSWMGDNSSFYVVRNSRDYKEYDLCKVDLAADTVKVIIKEISNVSLEYRSPYFNKDLKNIIWWSERTGWAQLYKYNNEGESEAITSGAFHVHNIEAVNEEEGVIYFTADNREKNENPYYKHLYRIDFDGSNLKLLNKGNFDNKVSVSEDGKYFVNNASRVDTAPVACLYNNKGQKIMELETADFSQLFKAGYKYPTPFTVKAADGITNLYGVMYKPFNFDPSRKYPIIEYVYPGPQVEATNYFWTGRMNRIDRLAQLGFIVVTVGNRGGHPDRSVWYHKFGYNNLRDYGLEDQKCAVQQLAAQYPWIDGNRVGIHGHSGGGFMSTAAILTYPDFYKVAVSCAGNHDNTIYNRWWGEVQGGVETKISADGKDTSFVYSVKTNEELAKNLKGHLLLVFGDMDNNVSPSNSIRVINALIKNNKRFEMLMLPGQRHGFGTMDEYFFWKMADYFSRYLIGDYQNSVDIPQLNNE